MKKKQKKYRVWFNQVNQSVVEVSASDSEDAKEKAYRKWRKDCAHSYASCIEEAK